MYVNSFRCKELQIPIKDWQELNFLKRLEALKKKL